MSPRTVVLSGITLLLLAVACLFLAAAVDAGWLLALAAAALVGGLLTIGSVFTPDRSSQRAGTKIWQNEGTPGGDGGGGI